MEVVTTVTSSVFFQLYFDSRHWRLKKSPGKRSGRQGVFVLFSVIIHAGKFRLAALPDGEAGPGTDHVGIFVGLPVAVIFVSLGWSSVLVFVDPDVPFSPGRIGVPESITAEGAEVFAAIVQKEAGVLAAEVADIAG